MTAGIPATIERSPMTTAVQHQPAEQTAAFDRSVYETPELRLPRTDGHPIDKIRVNLGGGLYLDRFDPANVELFKQLALGRRVELKVTATVVGTPVRWTTDKEGELAGVVGEKTLKVEAVELP